MKETIFISGIDTDAGKSYCTAWLGNHLRREGLKVTTQKFIQTGCTDTSEDIITHRRLMGDPIDNEPWELTAPEIYTYPASPHLSALIDKRPVDLDKIDRARHELEQQCDVLLVEGAGGLMVPITDSMLTIDYVSSRNLTVALVTNGRLGSISHTLLALEALASRKIPVKYLLYNTHFDSDPVISPDTRRFLQQWIAAHSPLTRYLEVPSMQQQ